MTSWLRPLQRYGKCTEYNSNSLSITKDNNILATPLVGLLGRCLFGPADARCRLQSHGQDPNTATCHDPFTNSTISHNAPMWDFDEALPPAESSCIIVIVVIWILHRRQKAVIESESSPFLIFCTKSLFIDVGYIQDNDLIYEHRCGLAGNHRQRATYDIRQDYETYETAVIREMYWI